MLYFEDLSLGMTETLQKVIDASDVVGFAEVTGDRNPIHLSEHLPPRPFGTRIAPGSTRRNLISAVLGTDCPVGRCHFRKKESPRAQKIGDTVNVRVPAPELVPEKFRARLACTCSVAGDVVLDGRPGEKRQRCGDVRYLVTIEVCHARQGTASEFLR
jgi:3-hydroxybutyryl-CoA dehydratase